MTGTARYLVSGVLIVGLVIVAARWAAPWLLFRVARTRNREVFILATVGMGLASAWLTSLAGLWKYDDDTTPKWNRINGATPE